MELNLFKPLWGHPGTPGEAVEQALAAGFNGIEGPVPEEAGERAAFKDLLQSHNLKLIAEVTTGGGYVPRPTATPECHLADLRRGIELSQALSPVFINTQTGLDAWDLSLQIRFFEQVLCLEDEYGITISVETHRSRSTFHPWITRDILRAVPRLKITCDFSHWCCVTERLVMDDDPELLQTMADRCHHLHARVGYDQGPQVPDPRAPEYGLAVARHRAWWEVIWETQRSAGRALSTMTPEFGTDGYLHLEPFTQKPVADLWELNSWMGRQARQWFAAIHQPPVA